MAVKNLLAYLLSAPPSGVPEVGTCILFGGRALFGGDEEHLQQFSRILLGLEKATFDALRKGLPFKWNKDKEKKYDTVNPFGDPRGRQYHALWTFDTQNDMLCYTNRDGCSQIPLALLRERVVSLADMESLGPVSLPKEPKINSESGLPYWKPQVEVDDRMRAFTHRLLLDFYHQWRHIFRNRYNFMTLKVLARAIILLSTLNFDFQLWTGGKGPQGVHVWVTRLPTWEPFKDSVLRVGNVCVILCEAIQDGLSIAQQHVSSQEFSAMDSGEARPRYMILSVKHIMLCYTTGPNSLKHTAPVPLFNGDYSMGPPSELALDYLIWATASARPSIFTPLHSLPIEVQDIILNYVSISTVVAAKVGCLLGLGSPFLWKDGPLDVELTEKYLVRPSKWLAVESEVWFDEHKSGVVYLA